MSSCRRKVPPKRPLQSLSTSDVVIWYCISLYLMDSHCISPGLGRLTSRLLQPRTRPQAGCFQSWSSSATEICDDLCGSVGRRKARPVVARPVVARPVSSITKTSLSPASFASPFAPPCAGQVLSSPLVKSCQFGKDAWPHGTSSPVCPAVLLRPASSRPTCLPAYPVDTASKTK